MKYVLTLLLPLAALLPQDADACAMRIIPSEPAETESMQLVDLMSEIDAEPLAEVMSEIDALTTGPVRDSASSEQTGQVVTKNGKTPGADLSRS